VYGYPLVQAAEIALGATHEALRDHPDLYEARFWLFDQRAYDAFAPVLADSDG
jgi:O-acetyl-ADP-ribose deacetylase (regulator of RNase III)